MFCHLIYQAFDLEIKQRICTLNSRLKNIIKSVDVECTTIGSERHNCCPNIYLDKQRNRHHAGRENYKKRCIINGLARKSRRAVQPPSIRKKQPRPSLAQQSSLLDQIIIEMKHSKFEYLVAPMKVAILKVVAAGCFLDSPKGCTWEDIFHLIILFIKKGYLVPAPPRTDKKCVFSFPTTFVWQSNKVQTLRRLQYAKYLSLFFNLVFSLLILSSLDNRYQDHLRIITLSWSELTFWHWVFSISIVARQQRLIIWNSRHNFDPERVVKMGATEKNWKKNQ